MYRNFIALCLIVSLYAGSCFGDGGTSRHGTGMKFLVAPLFGWDRNELTMQGRPGQTMVLTDTVNEYGLFTMIMHPWFVLNNTFFSLEPNDAKVTGDMAFLNVYGPGESKLTWNAGAGYTWHEIDTDGPSISLSVPMIKLGAVVRCPDMHVSFNPYLAYTWEGLEVGDMEEDYNSILYGLTVNWRWRMLQATLKYYLDDNQDLEEQFHTLRGRFVFSFTNNLALFIRVEYMEHSITKDTALLFGPAIVF